MNQYYYFLVLFYYSLAVHLCDSIPTGGLAFELNDDTRGQSSIKEYCEKIITYNQVARLLSRNTCAPFANSNKNKKNNDRKRRQIDTGNFDIKAIQTTINDNRNMIQYLFNNSINETILAKALYDHTRKAPSFTSWRDWVDIVCLGLFLIMLIYILACRAGFSIWDKLFLLLFQPVVNRLQDKMQQQLDQQHQLIQQQQPNQQYPFNQHHHIHQQQQLQKQQQIQQQQPIHTYQIHQQPTQLLPTAPTTTTDEQLQSLNKIADSVQPKNYN